MEVRSSRRMRTLVTRMAPGRSLSANEIARALISHDGQEPTLQQKAGYIDARPLTTNSTKFSCNDSQARRRSLSAVDPIATALLQRRE